MDNILISVVIPVYNVENYVSQCIKSVLQQADKKIEIIVINDGSTDSSADVCRKVIADTKKNICFLTQDNKGLSASRNRGIDAAKGKYIMFLDSDDKLMPTALSTLIDKVEKFPDIDVFYFDADIVDEIGDTKRMNMYDRKNAIPTDWPMENIEYFSQYYVGKMIVSACLCLINKEILKRNKIKFDDGRLYEDNIFSFKTLMAGRKVCYLPYSLYLRRYRKNSITQRKTERKDIEDICFILKEYIENKKKLIKIGGASVMNAYLSLIYMTFNWGYRKMECEGWRLQCFEDITDRIYHDLLDWPTEYSGLTYYLCMYEVAKKKRVIDISDLSNIQAAIREQLTKLLWRVQQMADKRIAIYGQGKHTDIFRYEYEKVIGTSINNYIYVDTFQEAGESHDGKKIINIKDISDKVDVIIISSYRYRLEMLNNCKRYAPHTEIFDFYDIEKINVFDEKLL